MQPTQPLPTPVNPSVKPIEDSKWTPTASVRPSNIPAPQTVSSVSVPTPSSVPISVPNEPESSQPVPSNPLPQPSPDVSRTTVRPTPSSSPDATHPPSRPTPPSSPTTPTPNQPTSQPTPSIANPHYTSTLSQKPSIDRNSSSWEPFIRRYRLYQTATATKLLFVVNYHEAKYQAVPFIESEYFPIFRRRFLVDFDVLFVGPRGDARLKVLSNGLPPLGYYSYHSLSFVYHHLCVEEECSYYGFVLMNDDSYLDPLFLTGYDLTQSWTEPSSQMHFTEHWRWFAWKNAKGRTFQQAFVDAVEELKNTEEGKKCHFERPENWRRGFADFFYITQKDMKAFYPMITVMKKHWVFLEMAAPTVNYCITHNFVVNCNHRGMKNRRTCVHMHPVKYRQPGMKEFALNRLYHKNLDSSPPQRW